MRYFVVAFLSMTTILMAQDIPVPPVKPDVPVVTSDVKVTVSPRVIGDGTRKAPYIFTIGMKGDIRLASDKPIVVKWETKDCPEETEWIDNTSRLLFPTEIPNSYVAFGSWPDGTTTVNRVIWFEIKGANGPPIGPLVDPSQSLIDLVKQAIVGPDSKVDASKYRGAMDALADNLDNGMYATAIDLQNAYATALTSVSWKAGKYPKLATMFTEVLGLGGPSVKVPNQTLDADTRSRLVSNFRAISKACQQLEKQ